jgi:hypothetical protein
MGVRISAFSSSLVPELTMVFFGHRTTKESQRHRALAALRNNLVSSLASIHNKLYFRGNLQMKLPELLKG